MPRVLTPSLEGAPAPLPSKPSSAAPFQAFHREALLTTTPTIIIAVTILSQGSLGCQALFCFMCVDLSNPQHTHYYYCSVARDPQALRGWYLGPLSWEMTEQTIPRDRGLQHSAILPYFIKLLSYPHICFSTGPSPPRGQGPSVMHSYITWGACHGAW